MFLQGTATAGWLGPRLCSGQSEHAPVQPLSVRFPKAPPYEEKYRYVDPAADKFASEKEAAEIESLLDRLFETKTLPRADGFSGISPLPRRYRTVAGEVSVAEFDRDDQRWIQGLHGWIDLLGKIRGARFFVLPEGRVRYEISSRNAGGLEYRVGQRLQHWSGGRIRSFEPLKETRARAAEPLFSDVTARLFGDEPSFREQLQAGIPYWRSRLDAACGINVYGQNGIAAGDIDQDGWDEVYVCQPGGLPNRLYKRRRDGTMQDVTEQARLGVLDDTSCALFVDFRNTGLQDLVILTSARPLYFLNRGDGTFLHQPEGFRFSSPPQGAFTGMSAADYDLDGKTDLYLCSYLYFRSEDQYRYPAPYHDTRTGPPNFLFRNRLEPDSAGFFEDVTEAAGLNQNNDRYSFAAAWCDYDGDGRPDLYIANDFGRNNLYKNEGGRFRDVAGEAGVEDIGPGMSVSWLDYDGDGRPDLYVTNMWSASGQRVVADEAFPHDGKDLAEAYQRHSKGNSFYRNRGDGTFEETSAEQGVEMGRWSWSGDALDLDADGVPEIYVTAGMLTNQSRQDLESFFWRQVAAASPGELKASAGYENGWNALNQLIREDYSWNGREANVLYARRNGSYHDVSGISGLDFADDSRAFAATDTTGDGSLDLFLKSRLGPQVRALENRWAQNNSRIVLSLTGTKSNRDAIGAWVRVEHDGGAGSQVLSAGSGYVSQHTKRLHFGLGRSAVADTVTIRWPSGRLEKLRELQASYLYEIEEGVGVSRRMRLLGAPAEGASPVTVRGRNEEVFEAAWLFEPVALPESRRGPGYLCLVRDEPPPRPENVPWEVVRLGGEENKRAALYSLFRRYLFDYRTALALPLVLLIDEQARVHKIYPSVPAEAALRRDLEAMRQTDRLALALPFPGRYFGRPSRNYYQLGAAFLGVGYPEAALPYLEEVIERNSENSKAQLALGQIHLQAGRLSEARAHSEQAIALNPQSPEAWNNLGGVEMAGERYQQALRHFNKSLSINGGLAFALVNAGQAHARLGDASKAEEMFRRALTADPDDAERRNEGPRDSWRQRDRGRRLGDSRDRRSPCCSGPGLGRGALSQPRRGRFRRDHRRFGYGPEHRFRGLGLRLLRF